jgi:hypothetical protein
MRIKNRLDPDYDSARSAGYRDVGVNLRVVTPETRALGVDAHVCELQLLLRRFAELKVRSGSCLSWTFVWKEAAYTIAFGTSNMQTKRNEAKP